MKRLLYLGLCLLLVAGMLTGCLSTPNDGNGTTVGTEDGTRNPNNTGDGTTNNPGGDESTNNPGGDESTNTPSGGDESSNTPGGDESSNTPGGDESSNTPVTPPTPSHTHVDADENGVCDDATCGAILFCTVTIQAPESVSVSATTIKADPGTDVTFTVTADSIYRVNASNASLVTKTASEDGKSNVWSFAVKAVASNVTVDVTAERLVYAAPVDTGYSEIPLSDGTLQYWTPMTVTVPAAGRYIIYAVDVTNGETISFASEKDGSREQQFEFEATAAGEVNLFSYLFVWSTPEDEYGDPLEKIEFEYYVIAADDLNVTLSGLTGGTYTLPTNVTMNVSVTLPTAGRYQLVSELSGLICDQSVNILILDATEDGQTVTFTMSLRDTMLGDFDFDWTIESMDAIALNTGANTVTTSYGKYVTLRYTVDAYGSYRISSDNEKAKISIWDETYGMYGSQNYYLFDDALNVGTVITLYLELSDEDVFEDIDTVVTVEYLGKMIESDHVAAAGADGAKNVFDAGYSEGWYLFVAPEGASIGVLKDGNMQWNSSVEVYLERYELFVFYVKSANATQVSLEIEKQTYQLNLTVGENNVTVKPGRDYTVSLSGLEETSQSTAYKKYYDFILSWTDENLQVTYQGNAYASGTKVTGYRSSSSYKLVITNTSDEAVNVVLTLQDPNAISQGGDEDDTNRGEKYTLSGTYQVNWHQDALYVLTFDNGVLTIVDNNNEDYSDTYTYSVGADHTVSITYNSEPVYAFTIAFDDDGYPTFGLTTGMGPQPMIRVDGSAGGDEGGDEGGSGLIVGTNSVDVPRYGEEELTFTATVAGTYTFKMTDANGYFAYETDTGAESFACGGSVSVELAVGDTFTFFISANDYSADNIEFEIVLEGSAGGDDEGDEGDEGGSGLIVGTNSIDVEDGYNGVEVTFTATTAGTYVFTVADANGYVMFEEDSWSVNGDTYTIELAVGESFAFLVATYDAAADTIDIKIEMK